MASAANAYDDAADAAYFDGWQSGDDGGAGFGPWTLRASSSNYFFVDTSRHNGFRSLPSIDANDRSWGIWSGTGAGDTVAFRPFSSSLAPGDVVRIQMDNGYVEAGTGLLVGVNFRFGNDVASTTSRTTGVRLQFFFRGGMDTYSVVDAAGERDTGVHFTDAGVALAYTYLNNNAYQLAITRAGVTSSTTILTGTLANGPGTNFTSVDSVALYALQTATGYSHDLFFNRMSINQPYSPTPTNSLTGWEPVTGALVENRRINAFFAGGLTEAQPALGDLDGDGDDDLVIGTVVSSNAQVGRILFFRNIGSARSPRWERPEALKKTSTNGAGVVLADDYVNIAYPAPALGDLDGDGDLDMLVGNQQGAVIRFENVGTPQAPVWLMRENALVSINGFTAPALADLDGDGDLDLLVGWSGMGAIVWDTGVEFFRNMGTPTQFNFVWQNKELDYSLSFNRNQLSPFLADMDHDGDFDLLLGRENGSDIQYRQNTGSPGAQYWAAPQDSYQGIVLPSSSPCLADTDGDGDLDLYQGGAEDIQYRENVGSPSAPSFQWSWTYSQFGIVADVGFYSCPALVDIDGDHDLDMVVGEGGGSLNFFRNQGSPTTPTWGRPDQSFYGFGTYPVAPVFGDLDGDGDPDMIVSHWGGPLGGSLSFVRNIGTPQNAIWSAAVTNYAGVHLVSPVTPALGDLDGDGDLDLVLGDGNGVLHYVRNSGTANAAVWDAETFPFSSIDFKFQIQPVLADFDLDGDLDLGAGEPGGFFSIFPNLGSPTSPVWGASYTIQIDEGSRTFLSPAAGDLDGDGDPDLIAGQDCGGLLHFRNSRPHLSITPVSSSVAAQDQFVFSATGTTGAITWKLAQNLSGGTIETNTGLYTAGTNSPALDIVRAQSTNGLTGLAYINIISPDDVAAAGKAIVIAGGKSLSDPVWRATDYLADQAYRSLLYKGFTKSTIQYLSFGPSEDVDGNLLQDDVDAAATLANAAYAFTNWTGNAPKLFVYLVDHGEQSGGQGYFRLNSGELLSASQLTAWLNTIQSNHVADVTVVMDFCYAGSFLDTLALPAPLPIPPRTDTAAATNYDDGWQSGDNGGAELLDWQLRTSTTNIANAGFFLSSSTNNGSPGGPHIDTGGRSWAMYANAGQFATAFRGLGGPVGSNLDLLVSMDNGYIDYGQTVGVVFRNGNANATTTNYNTGARLEVFFQGGSNNYFVVDSLGRRDSGVAFTDKGLLIRLARGGGDAYALSLTRKANNQTTTITGFLGSASAPALSSLDSIALFNRNAGSGTTADAYFNSVSVLNTNVIPRRTLVAATAEDELTYFLAGGLVSFSGAFFSSLVQGAGVGQAFLLARDAVDNYQTAQLDDNGDGFYNRDEDGVISGTNTVGASYVVGRDVPQIGAISPNQVITNGTSADIFAADVSSVYPLDRVWCSVIPPGHQPNTNAGVPVVDIPEVELLYNPGSGHYENQVRGLSEPGTYVLIFQARDIWGGVSLPKQSYLTQNGFDDRAALVLGGSTNRPDWDNQAAAAAAVYQTLRARRYPADRIRFLSPAPFFDADGDGTNDASALPSIDALSDVLTNWAAAAQRLTLYLVGPGSNYLFELSESNALDSALLDAWLDAYQESNRAANVILDFSGAGAFVTNLLPPPGRERISIAGARAYDSALFAENGLVSFSQYFLSQVFGGQTIGESFNRAKKAIRRVSGSARQRAQLDDNGNGLPDEKNDDGSIARARYLGTAFLTGADAPSIGKVIPPTLLTSGSELLIWAGDITDADGISNVWCIVTPPAESGTQALAQVQLAFNAASNRYETLLAALTNPGSYALTFYARDNLGEVSQASQSEIIRADAYEVDDAPTDQTLYYGPAQLHNFHASTDVDWVRFYAVSNYAYDISTFPLSSNVDTVLDLYREETNGALTLLDHVDDFGGDEGELLGLDFPTNGFYAVQVSPYVTNSWQPGSYEIEVTVPAGGGPLIVYGFNKLTGGALPVGAQARAGGSSLPFAGALSVTFPGLPAGATLVAVSNLPAGYFASEATTEAGQVENPNNTKYGNPRNLSVSADPQSLAFAYFTFIPLFRALGEIRDQWTGEWIAGAKIELIAPAISNNVYAAYPNAPYAAPWYSLPDGTFPTNVWLPTTPLHLRLQKSGYSNLLALDVVGSPAAGSIASVGTQSMTPLDANGNRIADAWETLYFGGVTGATNDPDVDGMDNLREYWSGSNPTNPASYLRSAATSSTNGYTLVWPTAPGRSYRVLGAATPAASAWTLLGGPWTALTGQTNLQWTDANYSTRSGQVYRIQVGAP